VPSQRCRHSKEQTKVVTTTVLGTSRTFQTPPRYGVDVVGGAWWCEGDVRSAAHHSRRGPWRGLEGVWLVWWFVHLVDDGSEGEGMRAVEGLGPEDGVGRPRAPHAAGPARRRPHYPAMSMCTKHPSAYHGWWLPSSSVGSASPPS
jgi:hypothetical protein